MVVRGVILDCDGVLLESEEAKTLAFEDAFAGFPAHRDAMLAYHLANRSLPRRVKFEHCVFALMAEPGNRQLVEEMGRRFSECARRRVLACPEVPGARKFLAEFGPRIPLYVASVTPQDELRETLRARDMARFVVEAFGDPPCPKADAVRRVLAQEGLEPTEVLFVGDSPSDYRVASEAGLAFIGRDSGVPFDGCEVSLYRDLAGIADVIRPWVEEGLT
jgi:phosphoglycolate phosphatase-like HAD superfamily hydrolase